MTYTFKGLGKDGHLAKVLLQIELNARKIRYYPAFSEEGIRIDELDLGKVKKILSKIKSPHPLKFEISNY
jgi:hypothetical protein